MDGSAGQSADDRPLAIASRAGGLPEGAKEQEIPRDHDPAFGIEEAPGAPEETAAAAGAFWRQLSGRFHLLQPGRVAVEAGYGIGLGVAAVPQSQAAEGRQLAHAAAYARLALARGGCGVDR